MHGQNHRPPFCAFKLRFEPLKPTTVKATAIACLVFGIHEDNPPVLKVNAGLNETFPAKNLMKPFAVIMISNREVDGDFHILKHVSEQFVRRKISVFCQVARDQDRSGICMMGGDMRQCVFQTLGGIEPK